jgi:HlyD family secretion protein
VITYDVVIAVANPQLLLRPGMTATASIVKSQVQNVLRVPSAALRFTPAGVASPTGRGAGRAVWVQRDGKLVRVPVNVGLNDNTFAEIKAGGLRVGDEVVVSAAVAAKAGGARSATTPSLRV